MNSSEIRLAVVGFGEIAQQHIKVFRSLGASVVAAVSRSPQSRRKAEQVGGIERTYADPLTMVESERPDGILVATSALSQFEVIHKLTFCDVPLLVEKPPAVSFGDWTVLCDQIEARSLPIMVGLNRRYYSVYQRALERMGGIEEVTSVSVEWSEDPERILAVGHPPGILPVLNFANSIHGLDLLMFFAGILQNVEVWGRNLDPSGQRFRWQMGFHGVTDRGVRAGFESNWDVPGHWRLVVDAADVRMVSAPLETAVLFARDCAPEMVEPSAEDQQFKPGFYGQASAFLELIRDHKLPTWPAASLEEASASMQLAERLTRACQMSLGAEPALRMTFSSLWQRRNPVSAIKNR
jgi:predicted dehydrogenase